MLASEHQLNLSCKESSLIIINRISTGEAWCIPSCNRSHNLATSLKEQAGSYVPTVIYNALQAAKVNVVVLSKGYAESEYCLKELVIMIRSFEDEKKPIIPVFYDVDFRDLRRIQRFAGPHGSALKRHEWRGTPRTEVKAWACALYTVSQMAGYCKAKYCNGG